MSRRIGRFLLLFLVLILPRRAYFWSGERIPKCPRCGYLIEHYNPGVDVPCYDAVRCSRCGWYLLYADEGE